jgi:hypothetical protein
VESGRTARVKTEPFAGSVANVTSSVQGGSAPANSSGVGHNRGKGRCHKASLGGASIAKELPNAREHGTTAALLHTTQIAVRPGAGKKSRGPSPDFPPTERARSPLLHSPPQPAHIRNVRTRGAVICGSAPNHPGSHARKFARSSLPADCSAPARGGSTALTAR